MQLTRPRGPRQSTGSYTKRLEVLGEQCRNAGRCTGRCAWVGVLPAARYPTQGNKPYLCMGGCASSSKVSYPRQQATPVHGWVCFQQQGILPKATSQTCAWMGVFPAGRYRAQGNKPNLCMGGCASRSKVSYPRQQATPVHGWVCFQQQGILPRASSHEALAMLI
jgi:hypothetical protein